MEWYFREQSDDLVVPNDQETSEVPCTDEISPSSDDWYQVNNNKSGSPRSPEKFCGRSPLTTVGEFDFDAQNIYDQVNNVASMYNGEGSTNSSACRESSLINHSAGTSEASFQDQPDFRLQNNAEQMDEIFLNSLLEDELQNLGSPYESLPMFPASAYRSISFENFLADVVVDPAFLVKECSFPESEIREDRNKDNSSSWSLIRDESKASEDSYTEPVIKNENSAITAVDEAKCLEETVLHKLKEVMLQLSEKTRICFRDALYRLAESSMKSEYRNRSSATTEVDCENSRNGKKSTESKTNAIDRTVANLLFNKPSMIPVLSCEEPGCSNNENIAVTGMQCALDQSSGHPQAAYYEDVDD